MKTDLVIFKAAHVLVSSNTVGTEEAGTVTAASYSLFFSFAAGAENTWCIYVRHIHCIHHHHIERKLWHPTDLGILWARWTHQRHLFQLSPSLCHLGTTTDSHLCCSISISNPFFVFHKPVKTARTEDMQAVQHTWLLEALPADLAEKRVINSSTVSRSTVSRWKLLFRQFREWCTICIDCGSALCRISHLQHATSPTCSGWFRGYAGYAAAYPID